jgi:hypothetical protein
LIAVLLVAIALVLLFGHETTATRGPAFDGWTLYLAGALAGLAIGIVASVMGVAGGELLIPTFVLLFGLDIKLAGSLSLVVSLPTMLVGFARYSRDRSFVVLGRNRSFLLLMAAGSIVGTLIGAFLLGFTSGAVLYLYSRSFSPCRRSRYGGIPDDACVDITTIIVISYPHENAACCHSARRARA